MQNRKSIIFAVCVPAMLLAVTSIASAGPFSNVISYGDSLSDNGNLFALTGQPPSPPYYMGRFSNGPVTTEQLTTDLGLNPATNLLDYSYGGATTGYGNIFDGGTQSTKVHLPGMLVEVAGTLSLLPSPVVKTSLFVVWGGPNDFFQQPPGSGSPSTAAQNIVTIVDDLLGAGARHILVPGMPDLSLTPEFHGSAAAQAFSQSFNAALQSSLPAGVFYFDTYGFMHNIVNHPQDFEFTNVTTPCLTGPPYSVCGNTQVQSEYLFWDGVHPTTTAASFLAAEFEKTVVPEPSTLIMLSTAIAGLAGVLRRKISA